MLLKICISYWYIKTFIYPLKTAPLKWFSHSNADIKSTAIESTNGLQTTEHRQHLLSEAVSTNTQHAKGTVLFRYPVYDIAFISI